MSSTTFTQIESFIKQLSLEELLGLIERLNQRIRELFLARFPSTKVQVKTAPSPDEILALATQVYAGLSTAEIEQVEKIAFARDNFFMGRSL